MHSRQHGYEVEEQPHLDVISAVSALYPTEIAPFLSTVPESLSGEAFQASLVLPIFAHHVLQLLAREVRLVEKRERHYLDRRPR